MPVPKVTFSHTANNKKHYNVTGFYDVVGVSIPLGINNAELFNVTLEDGAFFAATWINSSDIETTISNGIKVAYNLIFDLDN